MERTLGITDRRRLNCLRWVDRLSVRTCSPPIKTLQYTAIARLNQLQLLYFDAMDSTPDA